MKAKQIKKQLDKFISFQLKEMKKMREQGRTKDYVKHSQSLDLLYELRRELSF